MFETKDSHAGRWQRPVSVPSRKDDIFGAAKEMCEDLDAWTIVSVDEDALRIQCEKKGGLLGGKASILVWVEGPDGIPSSTTHVRSESSGGLLASDKKIVSEFVRKFTMRVC